MRLEQAVKFASENGFSSFTSTLFVSPYQQHERMAEIAARAGKSGALISCTVTFGPDSAAAAAGPRVGAVYAEVLRLRVQRRGPVC